MKTATDLIKPDYRIIVDMVKPESSVLDLGCGDGELLALLNREKKIIKSQGIEWTNRLSTSVLPKV